MNQSPLLMYYSELLVKSRTNVVPANKDNLDQQALQDVMVMMVPLDLREDQEEMAKMPVKLMNYCLYHHNANVNCSVGLQDRQDQMDMMGHQEIMADQEIMDNKDNPDHKGHPVLMDNHEIQGKKVKF